MDEQVDDIVFYESEDRDLYAMAGSEDSRWEWPRKVAVSGCLWDNCETTKGLGRVEDDILGVSAENGWAKYREIRYHYAEDVHIFEFVSGTITRPGKDILESMIGRDEMLRNDEARLVRW